ncbi:MAG: Uma2 family endonuclease [bacterium]|nr:Uma2 family endonuclease [bacterium]
MTVSDAALVTVEAFEQIIALPENQDRRLELIAGEIVETMPTEEHSAIQLLIASLIREFVIRHKLGRMGIEVRHQLPNAPGHSLIPDVSFTAGVRPLVKHGAVPYMPDLAVEVLSPSDSLRQTREKAAYYLANGTRLVWIVNPAKRIVLVLTPQEDDVLLENETLNGGDVLPGFTVAVRTLFIDPFLDAE